MNLKLITYGLSPYYLRIAAALLYLKIPFGVEYIDLENKPEWLMQACPTEKVPLLLANGKVLFKSLVILDYVNTLATQSLLPNDNLEKAINRSRAEFSNEIISSLLALIQAETEQQYTCCLHNLMCFVQETETWLEESKFIHGNEVSLADFAFLPIFFLLDAIQPLSDFQLFTRFPLFQKYGQTLLSLPGISNLKSNEYDQQFQSRIQNRKPFFLTQ